VKTFDVVAAALVVVGALNWGLVGMLNFDLVAALLGPGSAAARAVYALVGVCGLFQAIQWKSIQKRWGGVARPAIAAAASRN
jgi:uncharacterized membrane protein YuzA (DUF378 family)